MSERDVIGKSRLYVIVAGLAPAIQPVNVCGRAHHAGPAGGSRNRAKVIVLRKQLRRSIVKRGPLQSLNHAHTRDKSFGIVSHAKIELVDDARAQDVNPVSRPAVIFVEVMRHDSPSICVPAGPS